MQLDPLFYEGGDANLYRSLNNSPQTATDPSGLSRGLGDALWRWKWRRFLRWYDKNQDTSWADELPACPCSVNKVVRYSKVVCSRDESPYVWVRHIVNPDPKTWDGPNRVGLWAQRWVPGITLYHPGAYYELRSKPAENGARQQCCYDARGRLITHGPGAGTADKASSFWGHDQEDIGPFELAFDLDGRKYGYHVNLYLIVRPIDKKNKCPKNP
jgi:hypothetical protein